MNFVSATTPTGMRFGETDYYEMERVLSQTPLSYEASFKITSAEASTGEGFIFSNYSNPASGAIFNLRVTATGTPLIYLRQESAEYNYYINFSKVNVATGQKVHLAVTTDCDNFYCYVNGELKQTVARKTDTKSVNYAYNVNVKVRVGNQTNDNTKYFKGELYSLAMFSDERTAAEVAIDATSLDLQEEKLMVAYDFTGATEGQARFEDLSGNGIKVSDKSKLTWSKTSKYNPDDYAFSFMVVGDTQIVSKRSVIDFGSGTGDNAIPQNTTTYMDMIYDYIVKNVEKKKVKHVLGLGDITEYNAYNEWALAQKAISKMDGVVPYSLIPGNHDVTNWFVKNSGGTGLNVNTNLTDIAPYFSYHMQDGQIRPVTQETTYKLDTATTIEYYNTFFGEGTSYAEQYEYSYINTNTSASTRNASTVHFFTGADNLEYMVVALEYGPTDDTLAWASDIIEKHPHHNVIVTTHGYMTESTKYLVAGNANGAAANTGMLPTAGANGAKANCGDEMWAEFVSQHKNISMLLCGHVESDIIVYRQDEGAQGNVVTQMLCNPQQVDIKNVGQPLIAAKGDTASNRLTGMVATYYVSADGKTIDVEWYSPIQQAYYLEEGQFTFSAEAVDYPRVTATVKGGNGSVSPTRKDMNGEPVTVTFMPDQGYTIKQVTINGVNVSEQVVNNQLIISDLTYHAVEVEYQERSVYPLSIVNDTTKGTIELSSSASLEFAVGETITFILSPKGENIVKAVKFNGHTVLAVGGIYSVTIIPTDNILEVIYEDIIIEPSYSLTVVNDTSKGEIRAQSSLEGTYQKGTQISFSVDVLGTNSIKAIKFNGHTVSAVDGVYTVTIASTDNIIEIIYNAPPVGCKANLLSPILCILPLCGIMFIKKSKYQ